MRPYWPKVVSLAQKTSYQLFLVFFLIVSIALKVHSYYIITRQLIRKIDTVAELIERPLCDLEVAVSIPR